MGRSQTVPGYIVFVVVVYTPVTSRAGLFSEKGWGQAGLWKVVNGKGIPSCTLYLGTGNAEQRKPVLSEGTRVSSVFREKSC